MKLVAPFDDPILEMPVWTPGSYLVRDYAKNIQQFSAQTDTGEKLGWTKTNKTNWKITATQGTKIKVTYLVYAFELTVRTSYLDDRYGFISPAGMFFYIIDGDDKPTKDDIYRIKFETPDSWKVFTSLKKENGFYVANDFDELVDSPVALSHSSVLETKKYSIDRGNDLGEAQCQTVLIGYSLNQDINEFTEKLIKLQEESIRMFGELPYDRYLWILYVVGEGGGGLEHKYSNVSIIRRWYFKGDKKNLAKLLELESHEHFHTYNIKRIRPSQLGPFDYSQETYSRLLWVAEGLTSHYDRLFLPRAGLIEEKLYWELQADDIKRLEEQPGRKITSLEQSSFDAWIKLYKPDENQRNSTISYYLKGSIVGLLLDLEIRRQTNWERSLDDFFRYGYQLYKQNPGVGYPEEEFQSLVEASTDTDLSNFFENYIRGTKELPISDYLKDLGKVLKRKTEDTVYIGWNLDKNKKMVKSVQFDSPAMKAGIAPRDQILALDKNMTQGNYVNLVKNLQPGREVEVHVFRDHRLRKYKLIPEEPKPTKYTIEDVEEVSEEQLEKRRSFFSTDTR